MHGQDREAYGSENHRVGVWGRTGQDGEAPFANIVKGVTNLAER